MYMYFGCPHVYRAMLRQRGKFYLQHLSHCHPHRGGAKMTLILSLFVFFVVRKIFLKLIECTNTTCE